MEEALKVINQLERDGVIGKYAIGGAMALMFYVEPVSTYDLDIFCFLPEKGLLIDFGPLYKTLAGYGYCAQAEQIVIEGIPVQFIVPPFGLEEEALNSAVDREIFGVSTRFFTYEHLLAIMVKVGRPKDVARIALCLESRSPDLSVLEAILSRYNLGTRWVEITRGRE